MNNELMGSESEIHGGIIRKEAEVTATITRVFIVHMTSDLLLMIPERIELN